MLKWCNPFNGCNGQKSYRKEESDIVEAVTNEHAKTARDLAIGDRMFKTTARESFIILKDHKEDFETNPKVRLIYPTKPDIGKPAKKILEQMVNEVKAKKQKAKAYNQ